MTLAHCRFRAAAPGGGSSSRTSDSPPKGLEHQAAVVVPLGAGAGAEDLRAILVVDAELATLGQCEAREGDRQRLGAA
jgi:hypothetical protein